MADTRLEYRADIRQLAEVILDFLKDDSVCRSDFTLRKIDFECMSQCEIKAIRQNVLVQRLDKDEFIITPLIRLEQMLSGYEAVEFSYYNVICTFENGKITDVKKRHGVVLEHNITGHFNQVILSPDERANLSVKLSHINVMIEAEGIPQLYHVSVTPSRMCDITDDSGIIPYSSIAKIVEKMNRDGKDFSVTPIRLHAIREVWDNLVVIRLGDGVCVGVCTFTDLARYMCRELKNAGSTSYLTMRFEFFGKYIKVTYNAVDACITKVESIERGIGTDFCEVGIMLKEDELLAEVSENEDEQAPDKPTVKSIAYGDDFDVRHWAVNVRHFYNKPLEVRDVSSLDSAKEVIDYMMKDLETLRKIVENL